MIIDSDVQRIARWFGVDPVLIQAVVEAEGNILRAVQCSIPDVTTREEALQITCRSACHALSDFVNAQDDRKAAFLLFWQQRWAPVGAPNDPRGLNENWAGNVQRLWS